LALTDVAGVLSRKFVVGFFIPGFFACLALKLLVADEALPEGLRDDGATQILIVGGIALLIGLVLWGVHYPLIRVLEGYWLIAPRLPNRAPAQGKPHSFWHRRRLLRVLRRILRAPFVLAGRLRRAFGEWKRARWVRTRAQLIAVKSEPTRSPERTRAAGELTARFPPEDRLVLPTELGNVIRAFENHPRERYGLDGIPIWPTIVALLNDSERAELEDVTTDVAFWLNGLVVVVVGGMLLFAERLWHPPGGTLKTVAVEVAVAAAVGAMTVWMYRQLIAASARWGEPVRAAFGVHRFELYDRLGVRRPHTEKDDLEAGRAVNRLLAFAEPLPLEWRVNATAGTAPASAHNQNELARRRQRKRLLALAISAAAVAIAVSRKPPGQGT
jgi:hypothetical protein